MTAAGWYPDGAGTVRYWDGAEWTEHTQVDPTMKEGDAATSLTVETAVEVTGRAMSAQGQEISSDLEHATAGVGSDSLQPAAKLGNVGASGGIHVDGRSQSREASTALPTAVADPSTLKWGFDGGAGTYVGTQIAAFLVAVFTLGICLPWAWVMQYRWQAKHTYVNGYRLRFTGTAAGLFGHWVKWLLLSIITLGIYLFWVAPRLTKWRVEHQEIDPTSARTVVPVTRLDY